MLDKTIPYYNIIMRCDGISSLNAPVLPEGYRFRGYQDGDEYSWAQMEVDNNDFDTFDNAVRYFKNKYLVDMNKLKARFIGVEKKDHKLCGAVICWEDERGDAMVSTVHWLIVSPEVQGLGIGSALAQALLVRFREMGKMPVYLHTQPWSYKAIEIYCKCGFRLMKEDSYRGYENQSLCALPVLMQYMKPDIYQKLIKEML